MNSVSLLLQRANSCLESYPTALQGASAAVGLFIALQIWDREKLQIAEFFSKQVLPLKSSNPEMYKRISWIVPVGGIALNTLAAYTAHKAVSSLPVKLLVTMVYLGVLAQFAYGRLGQSDDKTISLTKLFTEWSGADKEKISQGQNLFILITTLFISLVCGHVLRSRLGWQTIPTLTAMMITGVAVETLCMKSIQSWNRRPA